MYSNHCVIIKPYVSFFSVFYTWFLSRYPTTISNMQYICLKCPLSICPPVQQEYPDTLRNTLQSVDLGFPCTSHSCLLTWSGCKMTFRALSSIGLPSLDTMSAIVSTLRYFLNLFTQSTWVLLLLVYVAEKLVENALSYSQVNSKSSRSSSISTPESNINFHRWFTHISLYIWSNRS